MTGKQETQSKIISIINKIYDVVNEWTLISSFMAIQDTYTTIHFYNNSNLFTTLTINFVVYSIIGYGMHKTSHHMEKKLGNNIYTPLLYYSAAFSGISIASGLIMRTMIKK